ncbi:hypothetical protein EDB84DRAFT_1438728 [Lactarius hengduanensis]|nr:hypothetical protein EDB84DRAFT_1438728 [Lactarius hengduanensis]
MCVAGSISLWPVLLAIVNNVKPILAPLWQDDRGEWTACGVPYNANKEEWNAVEEHVQVHFVRRKLCQWMVKFAFMRLAWRKQRGRIRWLYYCQFLYMSPRSTLQCIICTILRWHIGGENGKKA